MKRVRESGVGTAAVEGDGNDGIKGSTPGLRVHEWGLNPLFWGHGTVINGSKSERAVPSGALFRALQKSHVKLLARDVHSLGTIEGIDDSHVLQGKAVHRVEVAGVVVHIKPGSTKSFGSYVKYILDDGTGLVPCTQYERSASGGALHEGYAQRHELGDLLFVQGKLKRFRGAREVVISSARSPINPNEEILHWLRCVELGKNVYKPPFRRGEFVDDEMVVGSSQARQSPCNCGAGYAEPIGYCRCVAAPLALDPEFEFRGALLAHLAAMEERLPPREHLHIQFARDVRDNPVLKETAVRVVSRARSGGVRDRGGRADRVFDAKVIELLRVVMSSLYRDGALHFFDKVEDVYVLVSRDRVLRPGIEAVCRDRSLRLTQENEIIRALQGSSLFHHVPGSRIRACVHRIRKLSP